MRIIPLHSAAQDFKPSKLTTAREARGLTMTELADRAGISAAAVTQLEKGDIRPSPETLGRISMALGFPPQFFSLAAPRALSEHECHFRRARSATKREQRLVLARGSLLLGVAAHLDDYVAFPAPRIHDFRAERADVDDIEELAESVRHALGLGRAPIGNMVAVAEALGVFVLEVLAESHRLDAFSTWWGDRPLMFLGGDKGSGSRRRFDAGHELGHLLMHQEVRPGDKAHEAAADRFGSAFLMPRDTFERELPPKLNLAHLLELKVRWKVSLAAMIRRGYDLGLYSEATYRRGFVQLGRFGWREREPNEAEMEHGTLLRNAYEMVGEKVGSEQIAAQLGMSRTVIDDLLAGTGSAPTLPLY